MGKIKETSYVVEVQIGRLRITFLGKLKQVWKFGVRNSRHVEGKDHSSNSPHFEPHCS